MTDRAAVGESAARVAEAPAERPSIVRTILSQRHYFARAATIAAAALILVSFFLPWMDGAGPFQLRSFTGADFARLIRNFEITADSASSGAQVRGAAIAIYLVPALAANGALVHAISALMPVSRAATGWALAAGAVCPIVVLGLLLFLSLAPVNDFAGAAGAPAWGFWLTLGGAAVLGWFARDTLRRPASAANPPPP